MRQNAAELFFPDHQIPHRIIYNARRRRVAFFTLPDGSIEIRAPLGATPQRLQEILIENQNLLPQRPSPLSALNNEVYYQGLLYDVNVNITSNCRQPSLNLRDDGVLELNATSAQHLAMQLENCLIEKCAAIFRDRTAHFSFELGVTVRHISIRDLKSRWGSCSPHNASIRYNWRLIMAPPAILDYIVVHELAHLRIPNHSAAFWKLVALHDQSFKEHRRWLRLNGNRLFLPLVIT